MLSLIPNEHWDYSLSDAARGFAGVVSRQAAKWNSSILIPELGPCIPVRSARAAIVVALKALSLPSGASIGVPLYCCPVVFSAIKSAGHRAVFIDVDPATYCISAKDLEGKSADLDAVIAVHMFGNMCDIPAIRLAAPGKPIIEDCAQALGSCIDGKIAGSFGDIAVFSFRSGKYISAGEGGALFCAQAELETKVSRFIQELPRPNRAKELVHVLKTYLRSLLRGRPFWGLIGDRLWAAYSEKVDFTSQAPIVMGQTYGTDRDTAIRRLSTLNKFIAKQRSNADYYFRNLKVASNVLCPESPRTFLNRMQFPLLLQSSEQCDEFAANLKNRKISTSRPYKDITAIAETHYGYTGDCPHAENVAKSVLVIPCNYNLGPADIEKIAAAVNKAWNEIIGRQGTIMESVTIPNTIS